MNHDPIEACPRCSSFPTISFGSAFGLWQIGCAHAFVSSHHMGRAVARWNAKVARMREERSSEERFFAWSGLDDLLAKGGVAHHPSSIPKPSCSRCDSEVREWAGLVVSPLDRVMWHPPWCPKSKNPAPAPAPDPVRATVDLECVSIGRCLVRMTIGSDRFYFGLDQPMAKHEADSLVSRLRSAFLRLEESIRASEKKP